MSKSKFSGIRNRVPESEPVESRAVVGTRKNGRKSTEGEPEAITGRGRPRGSVGGKRADSEYVQATAYIRESTRDAVKRALLDERPGIAPDGKRRRREFSELVEDLLADWLKARK